MSGYVSGVSRTVSPRGLVRYEIEVHHKELVKRRRITGDSGEFVDRVARKQLADWEASWQSQVNKREASQSREDMKSKAARLTGEAQETQRILAELLKATLSVNDVVNWELLKDKAKFAESKPAVPILLEIPREPQPSDPAFVPQIGMLDKMIAARRNAKVAASQDEFQTQHESWQKSKSSVESVNAKNRFDYDRMLKTWNKRLADYTASQKLQNEAVDQEQTRYRSGDPEAIVPYCQIVLSNSKYPDFWPQEWEMDYNPETKTLILDYYFPQPEVIPTLTEVRHIASKNELSEKHLTAAQSAKLYDDILYQSSIRTIHELFEADVAKALDAIAFNGLVRSIDRGTGNETTNCVLSLQVKKIEFEKINLANIDPKVCFRQLRGVGSSRLHSITPVAPIQRLRRDDGRFVSSYDVADGLDEGYNLASMHWEDFEHLIREVFAKEFSNDGGEVRVTQASRDGGVDAVAFDPDPIRGGKIVIQAKRYTNTVGVGDVRDLYGTLMNEGANKGILVTTSDYGPDAYEFSKGKPLTLLNGANLLFLLEKHGHKARIDLKEAKTLAMQEKAK